jgi:hypothetical protein
MKVTTISTRRLPQREETSRSRQGLAVEGAGLRRSKRRAQCLLASAGRATGAWLASYAVMVADRTLGTQTSRDGHIVMTPRAKKPAGLRRLGRARMGLGAGSLGGYSLGLHSQIVEPLPKHEPICRRARSCGSHWPRSARPACGSRKESASSRK